ncbi:MAG TPA: carboxymuconolactone decarboxylase family protein [Nocardioidaceae bacterium]|nr:carboxymuconolactone decarboxylase family protein [Nocardioidaceae bacterium]
MTQRMNLADIAPDFYRAMGGLEQAIHESGIEPALYELIKIRASQLNGCAYCLDMHHRDARKGGESQRRLDVLSAWREAPSFFSETERAALTLTECATLIADDGVPQPVWDEAMRVLGEKGVAQVLMAVVAINSWNRIAVSTHQDLPADE